MSVNHQERATELFQEGYNCAQSVFAAFSEDLGMDFETALKLSSSFGGGMGRLREVCGAVSGMLMAAGLKYGYSDSKDRKVKTVHYALVQELAKKFEERNGSIICRELLGLDHRRDIPIPEKRTDAYYQKRPCAEMVRYAAEILDGCLNKNELQDTAPKTSERKPRKMKIAIPSEGKELNSAVCQSFGRTSTFLIVDTDTLKFEALDNEAAAAQGGAGIKAAQAVADSGAQAVVTFRCGANAAQVLKAADIKLYQAAPGTVKDMIERYNNGKLQELTEIHPGYHGHNE